MVYFPVKHLCLSNEMIYYGRAVMASSLVPELFCHIFYDTGNASVVHVTLTGLDEFTLVEKVDSSYAG